MARSAAVLAFAGLLAETSAAVSEPVADELGTLEASLAAHPDDPDLVWAYAMARPTARQGRPHHEP